MLGVVELWARRGTGRGEFDCVCVVNGKRKHISISIGGALGFEYRVSHVLRSLIWNEVLGWGSG